MRCNPLQLQKLLMPPPPPPGHLALQWSNLMAPKLAKRRSQRLLLLAAGKALQGMAWRRCAARLRMAAC
jgi:hypothetical protein